MDTSLLTARETARLIALGETSAEEVARDALGRAAALNPVTGAYLHLDDRGCLEAARRVDRARAAGETLGPLAGVPIALKDNLMTRGLPTTCGSRILEDYIAPYDATAVARLLQAGLVVVGKTNMDEFAMGSSTENSAFGPVRNPWSLEHVPGGSSGGSAAAVASGTALLALGSDTGGSVREPASFCGVVGYKPTYGRVSRYGLVAFGSSLDQIGPFARDVRDAALLYNVIAGHDPLDATSLPGTDTVDVRRLGDAPYGRRLGVPRALLGDGVNRDVRRVVDEAIAALTDAGMAPAEVALPHLPACVAVYYIIATAEASSNLARYDGVRYGPRAADPADLHDMYLRTRTDGFGREVKRRIMLGTYALSAGYYDAYYAKAQEVRTLIRRDFDEAFARADVLVLPVAPTPAFRLGERITDPLAMYLTDAFTIPANLAGLPAISVPAGESADGLPIGVQIIGPALADGLVFDIAAALERARGRGVRTRALAGRRA